MTNIFMFAAVAAGLYLAVIWPFWIILRRTGLNPLLICLVFLFWPLLFWIIAVSRWPGCPGSEDRRFGQA